MSCECFISPLYKHPDAISLCAQWAYEEWGQYIKGRTPQYYVEMFQKYATVEGLPHTQIALINGKPVGMTTIRDYDIGFEDSPLKPWLTLVFVDTVFRGKGIASKLVKAIEQYAKKEAVETLYLYTTSAPHLYAKLGWNEFDIVDSPHDNKDKTKASVMMRQLG